MYPWLNRVGASYSLIRQEVLLIGGIARLGCIPKIYEIMSIVGSFSAFGEAEKEMDLRVISMTPRMPPGCPRPLLVGHSTHRTTSELSLILGGGCTCFSFGSYWNDGAWTLYYREQGMMSAWALCKPKPPEPLNRTMKEMPKRDIRAAITNGEGGEIPRAIDVPTTTINNPDDLQSLITASQPRVINDLDIGPCTKLWTPSYLKSGTSPTRKAVIHSAPTPIMNFTRRDTFSYNTLPFHTFLSLITSTSPDLQPHMYLRSISSNSPSTTPANLSTDWPEIASDFTLPPQLSYVTDRLHSSPLRIATNVSMWLHYDVMANILFHVSSHPKSEPKRLILFPPSDLKHLSFPAGSTTSTLDIFQPQPKDTAPSAVSFPFPEDSSHPEGSGSVPSPNPATSHPSSHSHSTSSYEPHYPTQTHPQIALLLPGHALYIPPLWSHTAFPSSPGVVNISVNVFFRSMHDSVYPAGRDVYGNRDLMGYEEGRRDVEKIVRRFRVESVGKGDEEREGNGETGEGLRRRERRRGKGKERGGEKNGNGNGNGDDGHGSGRDGNEAHEETDTESQKNKDMNKKQGVPRDIAKAYLERLGRELLDRAEAL
jgi:tRNA wybutosine-synthesizing protein 4